MRLTTWIEQNLWNVVCAVALGVMSYVAGNANTTAKMTDHEARITLVEKRVQASAEFHTCVRLLEVWHNNGAHGDAPCELGGM